MFYKLYQLKGNYNTKTFFFCKKASDIDMPELICHKLKNESWKKSHYLAVFYRKAIETAKRTVAKLTSENYHCKSSILIDLLPASQFFSNWMVFSFVSFTTNRGFFLTCLKIIVYDYVLWRQDDFKDNIGIFF